VAVSPAMQAVAQWVKRAASTRATVLLQGETGTGKEVVARAIHTAGPDAECPFIAVNLAAVPANMVESELFGHERGAFTGAERRREGILRAAGSGTVFLDEIAELTLPNQAKLLRAVEAREVQPLGRDTGMPFEARIIAATHRDLEALVADNNFREDLYYRLNVVQIRTPPLRDRPEDIPMLVRHLLDKLARDAGMTEPVVTNEAMRAMCGHTWPGNVRELRNVLERAQIIAAGGKLDVEQLPAVIRGEARRSLSLQEAVNRFERAHIAMVLRLVDGNRDKAAAELGISPATLYRRLERLKLKGSDTGGSQKCEPDS